MFFKALVLDDLCNLILAVNVTANEIMILCDLKYELQDDKRIKSDIFQICKKKATRNTKLCMTGGQFQGKIQL